MPTTSSHQLPASGSPLTPAAKEALRRIRALRALPQVDVTIQAEKKALKTLSTAEALAVALELAGDAKNEGGR